MHFLKICLFLIQIQLRNLENCSISNQDFRKEIIQINGFNNFSTLTFNECSILLNQSFIEFFPGVKLVLDNMLNLNGLKIKPATIFFGISFGNLKGIDIRAEYFSSINVLGGFFNHRDIFWYLVHSNFDFYLNSSLIDKNSCNSISFFGIDYMFISKIKVLILKEEVLFKNKVCPLVFKNANLKLFSIDKMSQSFLNRNMLFFYNLSNDIHLRNNRPHIVQLNVNAYHVVIDRQFLSRYVFENLVVLDINGQINGIEFDLFKMFSYLRMIRFRTQNAKRLLTHISKWFEYLNYKKKLNALILVIFQTFSNFSYYDFPEEDFCIFQNFPHQRLVFPYFKPAYKSKCTCTELFLIQFSYAVRKNIFAFADKFLDDYYFLQQYYYTDIHEKEFSRCADQSFEISLKNCDFKTRLKLCVINTTNSFNDDFKWYISDWSVLSSSINFIFTVYINSILNLICIFISIVTIIILSRKEIEKNASEIYIYLKMHTISNLIYVIIMSIDLINFCQIEPGCENLLDSKIIQYYNLIFMNFFKNSLKTFSQITYLSFVMSRFTKITNFKSRYLDLFINVKIKKYLWIAVVFSFVLNIYICFEFEIRKRIIYSEEIETGSAYDKLKKNPTFLEYVLFNLFQFIKIVFSDLIFFILSTSVDFILIFFLKKKIREIKKLNHDASYNLSLKTKKKSRNKIVTMLILNGFNFLILRFPSSLMDYYGFLFTFTNSGDYKFDPTKVHYSPNLASYIVCRLFKFCESLQKIFYSFYLISILVQFFIFYKCDKNFMIGISNSYKRFFIFNSKK